MITNNYKLIASLLFVFFLCFTLNSLVPLISDDFSYMRMGLDFPSRLHHYMTWSGRIEADIISSSILQFDEPLVKSLINTIPMLIIGYFIHKIIDIFTVSDPLVTILITFSLYFLFNPNLGQTTFWIVGAANYLWTSAFCIIFIYSLCCSLALEEISRSKKVLFGFSALLAGCSNEASACLMVSTAALVSLYNNLVSKKNKTFSIVIFFICLIGFLVLIGAPGNKARLASEVFHDWRNLGVINKITYHFYERVPNLLRYLKYELIISLICAVIYSIKKDTSRAPLTIFCLAISPIIGFIFIISVLAFSPYTPERSVNIVTIILAIPVCLLVNKFKGWLKYLLVVTATIPMLINWSHTYSSYSRVLVQDTMRRDFIRHSIENGTYDITLPQYNFSNLSKIFDVWDLFNNESELANYFNVQKINVTPVNIDFSYLISQPNYKCSITTQNGNKNTYSVHFYEDTFNDVILIGEIGSNDHILQGVKQVKYTINIGSKSYDYELPSDEVLLFNRTYLVSRSPKIGISSSNSISFVIKDDECYINIK